MRSDGEYIQVKSTNRWIPSSVENLQKMKYRSTTKWKQKAGFEVYHWEFQIEVYLVSSVKRGLLWSMSIKTFLPIKSIKKCLE